MEIPGQFSVEIDRKFKREDDPPAVKAQKQPNIKPDAPLVLRSPCPRSGARKASGDDSPRLACQVGCGAVL